MIHLIENKLKNSNLKYSYDNENPNIIYIFFEDEEKLYGVSFSYDKEYDMFSIVTEIPVDIQPNMEEQARLITSYVNEAIYYGHLIYVSEYNRLCFKAMCLHNGNEIDEKTFSYCLNGGIEMVENLFEPISLFVKGALKPADIVPMIKEFKN